VGYARSVIRARTSILIALALAACLGDASAHSLIPTRRPLSPEEVLECGIGLSDAVLLGRVIAQEGRSAEVQPLMWFKGGGGFSPTWIGFDASMQGFDSQKDWIRFQGNSVLFFLANERSPGPHGLYPSRDDWAVIEGPYATGGGAQLYDSSLVPSVEREVAAAVGRMSADSLARRSDLVVVGAPRRDSPPCACTVYGSHSRCIPMDIEKILIGSERRPTVPMYSIVGGFWPERSVLFLKAMPDSVYELVSFCSGQIRIRGDSVGTGGTLEKLSRRLEELGKKKRSG
jgi:hypothetical protein